MSQQDAKHRFVDCWSVRAIRYQITMWPAILFDGQTLEKGVVFQVLSLFTHAVTSVGPYRNPLDTETCCREPYMKWLYVMQKKRFHADYRNTE